MSNVNYTPNFSLSKLKDDPDFLGLFAQKASEIKRTKGNLVEAAKSYQDKYQSEIESGTQKRQLMLKEGTAKGLTEDEIFKDNSLFIPTKQTPILNYLFFMLRETKIEDIDIRVLRNAVDADKDFRLLKEEYETKYGAQLHDDHKNELPNMVSFVYANIPDDMFAIIKNREAYSKVYFLPPKNDVEKKAQEKAAMDAKTWTNMRLKVTGNKVDIFDLGVSKKSPVNTIDSGSRRDSLKASLDWVLAYKPTTAPAT
jgi:hypothetical protein